MNSTDEAKLWAEKEKAAEAEAFEAAIKMLKTMKPANSSASKMLTVPFEVSDEVEQAYRAGYKAAEKKGIAMIDVIAKENAELRDELKIQAEQIQRLRECIARSNEEFYD